MKLDICQSESESKDESEKESESKNLTFQLVNFPSKLLNINSKAKSDSLFRITKHFYYFKSKE